MAGGRPVGAFPLSEPHAGSNPAAMTTEARRDGEEYVINGDKQWITNGERAGILFLFAKTDRDDPDSITQFLVPQRPPRTHGRPTGGETRLTRERHHLADLRRRSDPRGEPPH